MAVGTAPANDGGFDVVFTPPIAAFGRPGGMAGGIPTSWESPHRLPALVATGPPRVLTVGLAGYNGGAMAEAASVAHLFVVFSSSVHRIQEAQTTLYHVLWELTQAALKG